MTDDSIAAIGSGMLGRPYGLYWPRQMYGRVLRELTAQGARAVSFDVMFSDRRFDRGAVPVSMKQWPDLEAFLAALHPGRKTDTFEQQGEELTLVESTPRFKADIAALGDYAQQVLASVPAQRRVLVTAHDAFGYFGRAYGFDVQGIQGLSTESEAGLARIGALVELVAQKIPAVFVESSVSDRSIRAPIEGASARGHSVAIGGSLYSDAMGPDGSYEGTWLGMIDHNVTTIARALGGTAPERGRLGRLTGGAA